MKEEYRHEVRSIAFSLMNCASELQKNIEDIEEKDAFSDLILIQEELFDLYTRMKEDSHGKEIN